MTLPLSEPQFSLLSNKNFIELLHNGGEKGLAKEFLATAKLCKL